MHMYMYQHTLSNFPENCINLEDPNYYPLSSLVGCLDYHTPDVDISFTYTTVTWSLKTKIQKIPKNVGHLYIPYLL